MVPRPGLPLLPDYRQGGSHSLRAHAPVLRAALAPAYMGMRDGGRPSLKLRLCEHYYITQRNSHWSPSLPLQ